jgi:hypothetical protein
MPSLTVVGAQCPAYEDKAARRRRRGHEGIGPVVDVEQRPLRSLEEHASSSGESAVNGQRRVGDVWSQPHALAIESPPQRLERHRLDAAACEPRVGFVEGGLQPRAESLRMEKVTDSRTTIAGGAAIGGGLGPGQVGEVIGVAKAYVTRVGEGPFPTELHGAEGEALRSDGHEYGATTGRPRRCGWLDLPALRCAARLSGLSSIALTKLDVLSGRGALRVCVAFHRRGTTIDEFPSEAEDLGEVEAIYANLPGFEGELAGARRFDQLPVAARAYIELIEREVGLPVRLISLGPARDDTLWRGERFSFGDRDPAHPVTTAKFSQSS